MPGVTVPHILHNWRRGHDLFVQRLYKNWSCWMASSVQKEQESFTAFQDQPKTNLRMRLQIWNTPAASLWEAEVEVYECTPVFSEELDHSLFEYLQVNKVRGQSSAISSRQRKHFFKASIWYVKWGKVRSGHQKPNFHHTWSTEATGKISAQKHIHELIPPYIFTKQCC